MKSNARVRRLALLTHGFATGGGVPSVARWLRDELTATGAYDVEVIDLATSRADAESRRLASPNTWFRGSLEGRGGDDRYRRWGANAVELEFMRYRPRRELTRILDRYDLVQVVSGTPAWAAVAAKTTVPVVVQAATTVKWERQSLLSTGGKLSRLSRAAMTKVITKCEETAVNCADAVLVENSEMLQHVLSLGQQKTVLAPPGVNVRQFHPARRKSLGGALLSVCRHGDPRKRLDRMVAAYGILLGRMPNAPRLVIAGNGIPDVSIVRQIQYLGLASRVDMRSNVPAAELPGLYRSASAFVQTSQEEGLGLSVLEAMATGLPVVATETAGSTQTIANGVTGWLVPQEPEENIAERLADKIVDVLKDDGSMGEKARERCVQEFSTEATVHRFIKVHDELLARRRARASVK